MGNQWIHPQNADVGIGDLQMVTGVKNGHPVNVLAEAFDLATKAGAGITTGTGTVCKSSVTKEGGLVTTRILIDLTGLNSQATDLDIIGVNGTALACHIGQITDRRNGEIAAIRMTCLELPAGGDPNIALYSATEATGVWGEVSKAYTENLKLPAQEVVKKFTAKIPLGRLTRIEDVVDFVHFLTVSGDYCTGQAFNITGGREMH